MRDLIHLPAEKILAVTSPESLFSNTKSGADAEYKSLARRWHPDVEPLPIGARVFAHIVCLHRQALKKIADGSWNEPYDKVETEIVGRKRFRQPDGVIEAIEYTSAKEFELGRMYLAENHVAYEVRSEFADLTKNACHRITRLSFQNQAMAEAMSVSLPQIVRSIHTRSSTVLVIRKTPDQLLLEDVLRHEGGRLKEDEHTGWIINVLLNIACYLEWAGLTHNAINPSTVFISPLRHSGMLLGGWFYAALHGELLRALPDSSLEVFPADLLLHKRADRKGDYQSIKSVLCQLAGETLDSILTQASMMPSLREFLLMPSRGCAASDYAFWKHKVLPDLFGKPKFIRWNLTSLDIYKES